MEGWTESLPSRLRFVGRVQQMCYASSRFLFSFFFSIVASIYRQTTSAPRLYFGVFFFLSINGCGATFFFFYQVFFFRLKRVMFFFFSEARLSPLYSLLSLPLPRPGAAPCGGCLAAVNVVLAVVSPCPRISGAHEVDTPYTRRPFWSIRSA